ncbi:sensor histidine kinase [Arthrobacter tecti]
MVQSSLRSGTAEKHEETVADQHDDGGSAHGRSVQSTWLYTLGSIVFFCVVLDSLLLMMAFSAPVTSTANVLVGLTLTASAMQVRYCWFLRVGRGGGQPRLAWTAALLAPAATIWFLGFFRPVGEFPAALPLWIALCLWAALLEKSRRRMVLAAGIALVILQLLLATHPPDYALGFGPDSSLGPILIYSAAFPLMVLSSLWWWEIVVKLDEHRRTAAELAVARERLRFAADLHDIQGHHLQVIALKAELAERMLAIDPDASREHLHETRVIARQALEETRALVAGYREDALDNELENARSVLTAAGAHCELDVGPLPPDPSLRHAFAMGVREATTNILRHSDATWVSLRFSWSADQQYVLEIVNSGLIGDRTARTPGTGIAGLRARVAPLAGQLEVNEDAGNDRFELRMTIPSPRGGPA